MKVSKNWLKKYFYPDISDNEVADIFSMKCGFDVDDVVNSLDSLVVVVKINKIQPHPNADRLRLATVSDGQDEFEVVCGAPNIEVGQIVPLAKIGAKIGDITITPAEIRGVKSCGMLCSQKELGLGDDHTGIMILPNDYQIGLPLANIIGTDTVFDLEVTPNRGDCLSHIGVSRDLAACCNQNFKRTPIELPMSSKSASDILTVKIADFEACPRYLARVLTGLKVSPSPMWLQQALKSMGLNPINNIVDATNYIMFDLGQPLHAFDLQKITSPIIIRKAKKGDTLLALDDNNYTFGNEDILITDKSGPIAIAGIMGGHNTAIDNNTTSIVLEAAEFDAISIRLTSKRLGLVSDASYRFERGIDSGSIEYAINAAAKLIKEIAGGEILSGIVKAGEAVKLKSLAFDIEKINSILGTNLSDGEITHYLKLLGFKIDGNECIIPAWRHDVSIIEDLAEEVGRVYGYKNITPLALPKTSRPEHSTYYFKEIIKDELTKLGFIEQFSYPFMSVGDIKNLGLTSQNLVEVANPVQPENKYLRNTLEHSLRKYMAKNAQMDDIRLFEISPVFFADKEIWQLIFGIASKKAEDLEKIIESLSKALKVDRKYFKISDINYSSKEVDNYKIRKSFVGIVSANIDDLIKHTSMEWRSKKLYLTQKTVNYREVSKYPSLTRDLAFIIDKTTRAEDIENIIYGCSDLVNFVELFDEFASDKFGIGKKNVAFHLFLQAPDRTLNDDEADRLIKDIIKKIEHDFKAKLRDK